jgi:hypothetical protein
MSTRKLSTLTHKLVTTGTLAGLALAAASCTEGAMNARSASGGKVHQTLAERNEKLRGWMAREMPPAEVRPVVMLDGLASGELESQSELKPECKKTDTNGTFCEVKADLGKDGDGDAADVFCDVTTDSQAFGLLLHGVLGQNGLDETPVLEVKPIGEGISAWLVANISRLEDQKTIYGTAKLAALYAHGYVGVCLDLSAGGRKTFNRVAGHFFESLKFKENPKSTTLFAYGYQDHVGDRTTGFRYEVIRKRAEPDAGYVEAIAQFALETDGKTWEVKDAFRLVERDDKGGIDKMTNLFWFDGKGPAALSAKPSEDKKFRLKFESGNQTNGLESTPKAPLNTELWAIPELRKVASGASQSYRYAFLDLLDSDPAFHYITLTRTAPGVLLEDQEPLTASGKKNATGGDGSSKDELHVDSHGLVTKEVSTQSVSELVYTWGELPALIGGKKGTLTKKSRP